MDLHLAKIYAAAGIYSEAANILTGIVAKHPSMADAHFQLGWISIQEKRWQDALTHLQEAKKWMPDIPGLQFALQQVQKGMEG